MNTNFDLSFELLPVEKILCCFSNSEPVMESWYYVGKMENNRQKTVEKFNKSSGITQKTIMRAFIDFRRLHSIFNQTDCFHPFLVGNKPFVFRWTTTLKTWHFTGQFMFSKILLMESLWQMIDSLIPLMNLHISKCNYACASATHSVESFIMQNRKILAYKRIAFITGGRR